MGESEGQYWKCFREAKTILSYEYRLNEYIKRMVELMNQGCAVVTCIHMKKKNYGKAYECDIKTIHSDIEIITWINKKTFIFKKF